MITDAEYKTLSLAIKNYGISPDSKDPLLPTLEKRGLLKRTYFDDFDRDGWYDLTSAGRLELNLYERSHR